MCLDTIKNCLQFCTEYTQTIKYTKMYPAAE